LWLKSRSCPGAWRTARRRWSPSQTREKPFDYQLTDADCDMIAESVRKVANAYL